MARPFRSVLIYSDVFFPSVGGGEIFTADIAHAFQNSGIKTTVLTTTKCESPDIFVYSVKRLVPRFKVANFNLDIFRTLGQLKKENPDLLILNGPTPIEIFLILAAKLNGIPCVMTFHGQFNNILTRGLLRFYARVYNRTKRVLTQSVRDKRFLLERGVYADKISLMHFNGVDRVKYNCSVRHNERGPEETDILKLIFVGGISKSRPYKGLDTLIDVMNKLCELELGDRFHLDIVGGGDLLDEMKTQVNDPTKVVFHGKITDKSLVALLCASDLLVLPSKSVGEGFGKVALEAISCGLPVIVSRFAGVSELILESGAGVVYDPSDPDSLVRILTDLSQNKKRLQDFRKLGFHLIESKELELEQAMKKIIDLCTELVN